HSHPCACAHCGPRPDRRPLPQAQVAALEQNHSPAGLEAAELRQEVERLRGAQARTERTLEARERAHQQRVRGLEEQVSTLKGQLQQELRRHSASFSPPSGPPEK
ncbi:rootletin-like, partial [Oryx dammah]|uniref:rootletin-like n=1 Tax=Oryx dammah TaxID=59534 RepID=UPI001A9C25BE